MTQLSARYSVDHNEYFPLVGDYVQLSQYKFNWEVVHISLEHSTLYLRSVIGNRPAQVVSSAVTAIWRNPNQKHVPEYRGDYSDDWWEDEDWNDVDDD